MSSVIVDSNLSFKEALAGSDAPSKITKQLCLCNVEYIGFDKQNHQGQLVTHHAIAHDIQSLFDVIKQTNFPINSVIPVVSYNWDDHHSMQSNNTYCFHYRTIEGDKERLSKHALGLAIDINPIQNPYTKNHITLPRGAAYRPHQEGTLDNSSPITQFLKNNGWTWGGDWKSLKDYHHFEIDL